LSDIENPEDICLSSTDMPPKRSNECSDKGTKRARDETESKESNGKKTKRDDHSKKGNSAASQKKNLKKLSYDPIRALDSVIHDCNVKYENQQRVERKVLEEYEKHPRAIPLEKLMKRRNREWVFVSYSPKLTEYCKKSTIVYAYDGGDGYKYILCGFGSNPYYFSDRENIERIVDLCLWDIQLSIEPSLTADEQQQKPTLVTSDSESDQLTSVPQQEEKKEEEPEFIKEKWVPEIGMQGTILHPSLPEPYAHSTAKIIDFPTTKIRNKDLNYEIEVNLVVVEAWHWGTKKFVFTKEEFGARFCREVCYVPNPKYKGKKQ
jgi:hypothetical protein